MFEKLKLQLRTATARQTLITSVSTVANGILGALFYFFLARFLGAFDYGIFSLGISLITTLSGVFDLGSDQSLILFIPKLKEPDFYPYLKLALIVKLLSGFIILIFLLVFSKYISESVLRQPSLHPIMILVGLGIISQLLFSFATSVAQSLQKYTLWGILFVYTNLIRVSLLFVLYFVENLNVSLILSIYILIPLLGFLVFLPVLNLNFLKSKISQAVIHKFFSFNKWITGFVILSAVNSRLDVFFVARYISLSAVGIYSLCLQIVSVLPQLTSAVGAVISPKFSSFTQLNQNIVYVKKTTFLSAFIACISALVLIPISLLIFNFSGPTFSSGFVPFTILLTSSIIFLAVTPIRDSILYYFAKPRLFFYTGLIQIILYLLTSQYLMTKYSIIGTSVLVLINIILSSFIYSVYYVYLIKKNTRA